MCSFLLNKIFACKSLYTESVYFVRLKAKNFSKLCIADGFKCITHTYLFITLCTGA